MNEDRHVVVARALLARLHDEHDWVSALADALAAERRAALEQAARVCEERAARWRDHDSLDPNGKATEAETLATRIRALIPQPSPEAPSTAPPAPRP